MTKTRILLIDDNQDIHEDFNKVLTFTSVRDEGLDDLESDLFGDGSRSESAQPVMDVELVSALQGEDGVALAAEAAEQGNPFALAFVDVRMPPGIDGIQTIKRIWQKVPDLQCVVCTAYSDYDWNEIRSELGTTSNLLILKKPFDTIEVLQLVHALTEKHRLAQERNCYHRELEEKVVELKQVQQELVEKNEAIRRAQETAESHSQAKSQFLANVSHELRTPLNGVIGMIELLLTGDLSSQHRKYARTAKSSAELLLELLNEVLDFSKIEAGKVELEGLDFCPLELTESIVRVVGYKCREKGLNLAYYVDPRLRNGLRGDPGRIRQVMLNLVNNAVKFTEKGEVTVNLRLIEQDQHMAKVRCEVTDTGIGISPESRSRLFQAFSQLDSSTSRKYGGTGLGLAICRQLCELMGGTVEIQSEEGKGSTFWFELPLEWARQQQSEVRRVPEPLTGTRVLVVDNSPTHGDLLAMQLRSWGFDCIAAYSSGQALELLCTAVNEENPYRVVLIDAGMPGMNGNELAISIKANPRIRDAMLIVLLQLEGDRQIKELQAQGFNDYVSKPIMQSELFDLLLRAARANFSSEPVVWHREAEYEMSSFPSISHHDARILVAEDNEVNQEVAMEILRKAGYHCEAANDGLEAVEMLNAGDFDLVLMDMQMPEVDGIEATRQIRDGCCGPENATMPVVALTANAMVSDRERCLESGMNDYLSKPLDPTKLIRTVESWLDHRLGKPFQNMDEEQSPERAAANEPLSEKPIDLDALVERSIGNLEFAQTMLDKFLGGSDARIKELEQAIEAREAERVAAIAHSLKGSAGNLAANALCREAGELEKIAEKGDLESAWEKVAEIRRQINRSREYASEVFPAGT